MVGGVESAVSAGIDSPAPPPQPVNRGLCRQLESRSIYNIEMRAKSGKIPLICLSGHADKKSRYFHEDSTDHFSFQSVVESWSCVAGWVCLPVHAVMLSVFCLPGAGDLGRRAPGPAGVNLMKGFAKATAQSQLSGGPIFRHSLPWSQSQRTEETNHTIRSQFKQPTPNVLSFYIIFF